MPLTRLPLAQMTPQEALVQIRAWRIALERKMRRERAYLERRAARHVYTSTDEALEQDQVLEADLIALFEEMEQTLGEVAS